MKLRRPVIVQALFTLGGKAIVVCDTVEELITAVQSSLEASPVAEVSVREIHVGDEEYVKLMERLTENEL